MVVVRISEGSCTGAEVYREEVRFGVTAPPPPVLGQGTYCFAAELHDSDCIMFAEGETTVDLPLVPDVPVVIDVAAATEMPECDPTECMDGMCAAPDAGPPPFDGGGVDAGPPPEDGGPPPVDGGPDGGPPPTDGGPVCMCDPMACPPTYCVAGTTCLPLGATTLAGMSHNVCAITPGRALFCWGRNTDGALGLGDTMNRTLPTQVGTDTDWESVSVGFDWACATKTSGALYCWGSNGSGQLGLGDTTRRLTPTRVGSDTDWASLGAAQNHMCAIKDDGRLYCWGNGADGRTGLGAVANTTTPQRVGTDSDWAQVSGRDNHTCAVKTTSTLYCWGDNTDGQLGLGAAGADQLTPQLVVGRTDWAMVDAGGSGIAGGRFTCALTDWGGLYCWGDGANGALGQGARTDMLTPTRVGGDQYEIFQAGPEHVCAVREDGALYCWGENVDGQLGTGDTGDRLSPARVGTDADWKLVLALTRTSCGLKTDGRVYCWGDSANAERGDGTTTGAVLRPGRTCL
jgi:alpha-tubulin suppressor-like RCC1 family protein